MPHRPLWLSVSAAALCALGAAPAHAACTVTSGGDGMGGITSGATVTCEDNLDTEGVSAPDASGVTVDIVAPSGGISVTGDTGILLGDGATINVAGESNRPVTTSGDGAPAIDVLADAEINVDGRVATSGENSGAITATENAQVTVNGVVTTGGGDSDAINVGANSTVTVGSRANVNTQNSGSGAVVLAGDGATLRVEGEETEMNGFQAGLVTTSSGGSNPVRVEGNDGTVEVGGEIRSSSGDATAVLVEGNGATITVLDQGLITAQSSNSDAVAVTGTGATITVEAGGEIAISSGNSAAIVSGAQATVEIAGTVSASSSQSQGVVLGDASTLTVANEGVIETSSSESQAVLIAMEATTATVTVERGGDIDAIGAQAIVDEGTTETTVTIDGRVFGGSSDPVIDLGGGTDEVTVAGTLSGQGVLVDGGGGTDTVSLTGNGDYASSQFADVEVINTGGGGGGASASAAFAFFARPAPAAPSLSFTVDDDASDTTFNVGSGSGLTVAGGGTAGTVNGNGGDVEVQSGGRIDTLNASAGNTTVRSGGTVGVTESSGGGGSITFESGSTAEVQGEATSGTQTQRVAGADFQEGSRVSVGNSQVLRGTASGDSITLDLPADAFAQLGDTDTRRSFGAAVDAGAASGDPDAAALITASAEDLERAIAEGSGEGETRAAAAGAVAALAFAEVLTERTAPTGQGAALSFAATSGTTGTGWAQVWGGRLDADGDASGSFEASYGGLAAGIERTGFAGGLDLTYGLAVSRVEGSVDGGPDFDATSLGIYAGGTSGPLYVAGSLAYTRLEIDDGGDGDLISGRAEIAYDLRGDYDDDVLLAPYAALSFVTGDFDGSGNLSGGEIDQGTAEIGLRLGRTYATAAGATRLTMDVGYEHAFGDDGVSFDGSAFGAGFTAGADTLGEDRLKLGLGVEAQINRTTTLSVRYDGRFGDGRDHRLGLGIQMKF
ncbi:autotransporter domain-containing protein [Jannaschia sp. Os4]|uniref:autotransporter outer membrane beta-barrel domain-containing protein n=1 Tax=Jannaschia sp. Os4 TaxID=2807617 RepID=UPI001939C138|nr:autotransporter domain-containing protein [Jannaschia sp. Os4]MBM2575824.1 autotransporter domain-containing protein [Jannaschia sp. Os4]